MIADLTERSGQITNTLASYSGGPGFKSRPGDRVSCFRGFLGPSRQTPVCYLKLGRDFFLPHPLKFIIHLASSNTIVCVTEKAINKLQINKDC
jgi:hypothetical protein